MRRADGQRAAVYCRVGSARQAEYGRSLEVQRTRVEAALRGSGAVPAMVFVDIGVPGSVPIASRPQGQRLYEAVRSGDGPWPPGQSRRSPAVCSDAAVGDGLSF